MTILGVFVKLRFMRPTTTLSMIAPLLNKPFFTSKEAQERGVHPAVLAHYVKTGHLRRVQRGVYQKAGYTESSMFRWEDLIEAVYSTKGGVICLISALGVYDLTEEMPRQHWIAVRHDTSSRKNHHCKIVRLRNMELGKTEVILEGLKVAIFDRERTVVDAFRLLSRETAIKALRAALAQGGKNRLDVIKLQMYAERLRVNIAPYLMSITT
jgi:predicted transcriptional regulator of viral defense system